MWNYKTTLWASVSVTLFFTHSADRRHLYCPNTCQVKDFTVVTLCDGKIRASINTELTSLAQTHHLTLRLTFLHYTQNILGEQINQQKVTWEVSLQTQLPGMQVLERGISLLLSLYLSMKRELLWSCIVSNLCFAKHLLEIPRGVLSPPLCQPFNQPEKWLALLQAETRACFMEVLPPLISLQSLICIISV